MNLEPSSGWCILDAGFIRAEGLIPVSVGNIPLWGEIKGIKPECNSLAERTIPRTPLGASLRVCVQA